MRGSIGHGANSPSTTFFRTTSRQPNGVTVGHREGRKPGLNRFEAVSQAIRAGQLDPWTAEFLHYPRHQGDGRDAGPGDRRSPRARAAEPTTGARHGIERPARCLQVYQDAPVLPRARARVRPYPRPSSFGRLLHYIGLGMPRRGAQRVKAHRAVARPGSVSNTRLPSDASSPGAGPASELERAAPEPPTRRPRRALVYERGHSAP